jgi:CRISPR/Cas system-associated exonuclease Cas4 (RecB family)
MRRSLKRSSREKRYHISPKTCALFEHEYDMSLDDRAWKSIADDVEQCLRNFYSSEIFALIKELPQHKWLEVEDFSFFYLNGTKIWAVIDCSFRTDEGATIIDWKTGRHPNDDVILQLACYAMYAVEKWNLTPDTVKSIEYNLLSDQASDFFISAGEMANATSLIRGSIADMQSLLVNVENNMPKEEQYFRKVENDRICDRCNFRKVCY